MSARLDEICKIVSANTDDAIDDLIDLMKPESMSREEMRSNFESVVGYDPISYHDKKEISDSVHALRDIVVLSEKQEDVLAENHEEIVNDAYDRFNDKYRSDALNDALTETLADWAGIDYAAADEEENDSES